jgi:membrane-bound serine protease (ClpP class)
LIAISTREIYVAPIAAIGAAAPVGAGGEDLSKTMSDKVVSSVSGYFRSVAERNGHNPNVAEAFINKEVPVVILGQEIHQKGSVLTLSAQEAIRKIDGKPLLAVGMADSMADLVRQAGLQGTIERVEPTEFEQVAFWITSLAPLLLLGGIVGAWIEIKTPGFGLPGIASAFCFATFFLGQYLAGLAGWELPVLFLVGLALVLGEVLVHPGTIIPGLIGLFLMVGALFWAMVDRYPGQPWLPSPEALQIPLLNLGIAVVLAIFTMMALARYLPKTPFYQRLVLGTHNPAGPAFSPTHSEFTRLEVGAEGVAISILRPSGKAEFFGEPRDVITTGEFVERGTPIRVLAVEGSRIVVQPIT